MYVVLWSRNEMLFHEYFEKIISFLIKKPIFFPSILVILLFYRNEYQDIWYHNL